VRNEATSGRNSLSEGIWEAYCHLTPLKAEGIGEIEDLGLIFQDFWLIRRLV
jgi:hypothetical protein